ncbi:MAG: GNAT family N-acetyltransferase [Candidatus Binatia bacterium]
MSIRRLGNADPEQWLEIARRSAYATYFHTPGWADLMARAYHLAPATQAFRLADGETAVLPLLAYTQGLFRGYKSMAPGVYGGPIAERSLASDEVNEILDLAVTPRICHLRVFGNPYLEAFACEPEQAEQFTHVIDLRDGFEAVFRRFHQNHRRTYKAGARSGLVVDRARSIEDYHEYFRVYQLDRRRWGARAATDDPLELFEEIRARADPQMILWLARLDQRVVAGDLFVYWRDLCIGWHGAADPAFFDRHPTNFLLTEIIRDACRRGVRWLDLNPSGGHAGVVAFKDSFGAERRYFRHGDRRGSTLYGWTSRVERSIRARLRTTVSKRTSA